MLWMHQEAHVTPFTCAEGGEGWRAGHQWTLPTSEHLRSASLSPPVLGMTDSAMCCHLRSAPKLGGVQTARAEAEKLVHVQRVCVQMYVHMLYECGRLCRTLSHVTLLAVPNWLWKQRFTSKRTLTYRDCEPIKWTQPTGTMWNCALTLETFTPTWKSCSLYMVLPLVDCSKCKDQYCLPFSRCFCLLKSHSLFWKRG